MNKIPQHQQLIRQKAQELINAIDNCPGTITLGSTAIEKDKRFITDRNKNQQIIRSMVAASFKRKYPYN